MVYINSLLFNFKFKLRSIFFIFTFPKPNLIMCGDISLHHTVWAKGFITIGTISDKRQMIRQRLNLPDELCLQQQVYAPTHKNEQQ